MAYKKPKTKKETLYFPKDYPKYKIVKVFRKTRSPRTRIFATNDKEGWFIDTFEIKTRTGEVVDNEGWITEKDMADWTTWYAGQGWEEVDNLTKT